MKRTICLLLLLLLFSFTAVSAQTIETLDPANLGDYLSWDDQGVYIMAMLMNINLSDSSFTWSSGQDEKYGTLFVGTYEDAEGTYIYTFQIDPNTSLLREVVYTAIFHDNDTINSTMKRIKETYGLDRAAPYANPVLTEAYSQYAPIMDEFKMVASDATICTYGYLSAKQDKDGMILLVFSDRGYYQDPVG